MTISTYINPESLHSNPAFTQVVRVASAADTIYVGGQNGVDSTGRLAGDDIASQTRQAMANLTTCLEAAGATIADVVKWTILLRDDASLQEGFAAFGQACGRLENPPAITVAKVSGLAVPGALVEIEAVAAVAR
ncbi:RidA family protein [Nocardia cyriacigeorgica]|uniref:RidA family protein n=1 Tax=Nocardia cyriacigeorgica TaxID=135487 RepID=UPI0024552649|nr:RidA family protein [Nocardia cyriacigeorgica]